MTYKSSNRNKIQGDYFIVIDDFEYIRFWFLVIYNIKIVYRSYLQLFFFYEIIHVFCISTCIVVYIVDFK